MKISAYMTQRLVTVSPEMGARSTFFMMLSNKIRHLPVVDEGKLVGVISDRDLRRPGWADHRGESNYSYELTDELHVRDLMSTNVLTVRAGDTIHKAARLFREHRYGALPVVNKDGDLVGILSVYDMMEPLEILTTEKRKGKKGDA